MVALAGHPATLGQNRLHALTLAGKRGVAPANKLPPGESLFNEIFAGYRRRARAKGIAFELTKEQFQVLTQQPCHYCGQPPSMELRPERGSRPYNGVDRLDSSQGYSEENVITACGVCNHMKSDSSLADFINRVRTIADRLG